MKIKTHGEPTPAVTNDSTSPKPVTTVGEGEAEVRTEMVELDADTLASAELLVEQGAKLEVNLLKHLIGSASIMCAQGRVFGKAKKLLRSKASTDKVAEQEVERLCVKFGLGVSTMNRRIQMWDRALDLEIIDEELRHEIETSPSLTPEILAKMEARIGSITGTKFLRQLGILPPKEENKPKASKAKPTLEDRLVSELRIAVASFSRLATIRTEMISKGQPIDPALSTALNAAANSISAIIDLPIIRAKFVPVEDEGITAGDQPGTEEAAT